MHVYASKLSQFLMYVVLHYFMLYLVWNDVMMVWQGSFIASCVIAIYSYMS